MPLPSSGHVVVDGIRMEITGVMLNSGKITFRASVRGPLAAHASSAAVTVFGEDGKGICQGSPFLEWAEIGTADTLMLDIDMKMDVCYP